MAKLPERSRVAMASGNPPACTSFAFLRRSVAISWADATAAAASNLSGIIVSAQQGVQAAALRCTIAEFVRAAARRRRRIASYESSSGSSSTFRAVLCVPYNH
eukprot:5298039-Pleurochrysis_carterae.AAC.2